MAPRPEPGRASGEGVTRVQRMTESGSGSPEATPCRKGSASVGGAGCGSGRGAWAWERAVPAEVAVPAMAADCRKRRREGPWWDCARGREGSVEFIMPVLRGDVPGCNRKPAVHRGFTRASLSFQLVALGANQNGRAVARRVRLGEDAPMSLRAGVMPCPRDPRIIPPNPLICAGADQGAVGPAGLEPATYGL